MKIKNIILATCMVFLASVAFSQTTIDAEYRPRVMVDGGYKTIKLATDPVLITVSQRSRLNIGFKSKKLDTYFSIQDVRFWGDDDNFSSTAAQGSTKGVSIHQAWFMFKPSDKISIKTGRQQFSYDDQRILSARNWNDYQVTYDALFFSTKQRMIRLMLLFRGMPAGRLMRSIRKGNSRPLILSATNILWER